MENIADDFPIVKNSTYLNTAVFGPLHRGLIDWRRQYDSDSLADGSQMWEQTLQTLAETRQAIGDFFNVKADHISLVYNFSLGLNILLEGLDAGKKVLLLKDDYPSLNWPFESRGFKTTSLELSEDVESQIEQLVHQEDIDVFAFSIVQWLDGFLMDLEFIKRLKQANPNLLIIADGTQFCGAASFDFGSSGIDILGTSGYKWLLAGYGNGCMLFADGVEDQVKVSTTGFNAAHGNFGNKDSIGFAKKFEPGHLAGLNFGSLKFSLGYLDTIGLGKITMHNQHLSRRAKQELSALGLLDQRVVNRQGHSTIFNIKLDKDGFQTLQENNIICSQRGDGVRISFNFYNTETDLESLVRILKTIP